MTRPAHPMSRQHSITCNASWIVASASELLRYDQCVNAPPRILYCHCAYAQVVPKAVKEEVLQRLSDSGVAFDAVADLCEMSARGDSELVQLAQGENVKIVACYPRAVRWLFSAAGAPLGQGVEVLNMRVDSAENVSAALLGEPADG
jgi:hypothetical protein